MSSAAGGSAPVSPHSLCIQPPQFPCRAQEVPPPISPKTKEEFQQKIGTLSAQDCSLQSKLKEYERLLQPSQLATKHEAVGTPRPRAAPRPGLTARAIRKLALLLQSAFQACTLLLWTASVALGIDRAMLVVLVGLGGVLQLAWILAGVLPRPWSPFSAWSGR